jgi:hypothetical protein
LDAPRVAQALQDELVGGGGALLAVFELGQIAVDGDAAAILGAPLTDLNPASLARCSNTGSPGLQCCARRSSIHASGAAPRILNESAFHHGAQDLLAALTAPLLRAETKFLVCELPYMGGCNEKIVPDH